jgi:hypothetical protein
MLLVELRPEKGKETIAAVEAPGCGRGEVGEQREAPRSGEEALDPAPVGGEVERPEQPELDHARPFGADRAATVTASGDGPVTSW